MAKDDTKCKHCTLAKVVAEISQRGFRCDEGDLEDFRGFATLKAIAEKHGSITPDCLANQNASEDEYPDILELIQNSIKKLKESSKLPKARKIVADLGLIIDLIDVEMSIVGSEKFADEEVARERRIQRSLKTLGAR